MKYYYFLIICWLFSCSNETGLQSQDASDTTTLIDNDTISIVRKDVSKKPVAFYLVPVNDPKLERTFGVDIYETPHTFKYLLRMHYEAMQIDDTLKIPNFGIWPTVKIKQGKDKLSCIIGFLDKKGEFKDYKMVTVKGNKLRVVVLKKYTTGRYRNVY